jgi:septal ring factor EnvC (AmiA/AmiB activator)
MGPEGYVLSSVFSSVLARHGLIAAAAALIFFVVIGAMVYYIKARIDLMRADQAARDAERAQEFREREQDRAARERERQALLTELAETRAQVHQFLTNHLQHLKEERDQNTKSLEHVASCLSDISAAAREQATDLRSHREEEGRRSGVMRDKLEDIHRAIIERRPRPNGHAAGEGLE